MPEIYSYGGKLCIHHSDMEERKQCFSAKKANFRFFFHFIGKRGGLQQKNVSAKGRSGGGRGAAAYPSVRQKTFVCTGRRLCTGAAGNCRAQRKRLRTQAPRDREKAYAGRTGAGLLRLPQRPRLPNRRFSGYPAFGKFTNAYSTVFDRAARGGV